MENQHRPSISSSIIFWRREPARHIREPSGDVDWSRILKVRSHDLQPHGQSGACDPDGRSGRWQSRERRERDPKEQVIVFSLTRGREKPPGVERVTMVMGKRSNEGGGQEERIVGSEVFLPDRPSRHTAARCNPEALDRRGPGLRSLRAVASVPLRGEGAHLVNLIVAPEKTVGGIEEIEVGVILLHWNDAFGPPFLSINSRLPQRIDSLRQD